MELNKPNFWNAMAYVPESSASGLVGAWLFNEGAYIYDRSLYGNFLNSAGTGRPTIVPGYHNTTALQFDGLTEYLYMNDAPPCLQLTSAVTVCTWVQFTATSSVSNALFSTFNFTPSGYRFGYTLTGSGPYTLNLTLDFADQSESHITLTSTNFVLESLEDWSHISVSFNAGNVIFEFNGDTDVQTTASTSITYNSHTEVQIGIDVLGMYFAGALESMFVYSRGLSEAELQRLSQNPYPMFITYSGPFGLTSPTLFLMGKAPPLVEGGAVAGGTAIVSTNFNPATTGNGAVGGGTALQSRLYWPFVTGKGAVGGGTAVPNFSFADVGTGGAVCNGTVEQSIETFVLCGGTAEVFVIWNPFILNTGVYSGIYLPSGERTSALVKFTGNVIASGGAKASAPEVISLVATDYIASGGVRGNDPAGIEGIAPFIANAGVIGGGTAPGPGIFQPKMFGGVFCRTSAIVTSNYYSNVPLGGALGNGESVTEDITTQTTTGNGAIGGSSAVLLTVLIPPIASAGALGGGSAIQTLTINSILSSGGALGGGSGVNIITPVLSGGGALGGGTATYGKTYVQIGSGGLRGGGAAPILCEYNHVASGGLIASGVPGFAYTVNYHPSGGAIGGGAAVRTDGIIVYQASGGPTFSGSALVVSQDFYIIPLVPTNEELIISGSAEAIWGYVVTASGGLSISGSAQPNSTAYDYVATGGIVLESGTEIKPGFLYYMATGGIVLTSASDFIFTYNDIPCIVPGIMCDTIYPVEHQECENELKFYGECLVYNRPKVCRTSSVAILPAITVCRQKGYLPPQDRHPNIPKTS